MTADDLLDAFRFLTVLFRKLGQEQDYNAVLRENPGQVGRVFRDAAAKMRGGQMDMTIG